MHWIFILIVALTWAWKIGRADRSARYKLVLTLIVSVLILLLFYTGEAMSEDMILNLKDVEEQSIQHERIAYFLRIIDLCSKTEDRLKAHILEQHLELEELRAEVERNDFGKKVLYLAGDDDNLPLENIVFHINATSDVAENGDTDKKRKKARDELVQWCARLMVKLDSIGRLT